jgi:L-rhamnose mutarotase
MDGMDINAKWQAAMAPYTAANTSPIDQASELEHYFYLGDDRVMHRPGVSAAGAPEVCLPQAPQAYTGGGGLTAGGLKRHAFQIQFNPALLEEYRKDHESVWPEMQQAIRDAGWHNYSLFCRKDGEFGMTVSLCVCVCVYMHACASASCGCADPPPNAYTTSLDEHRICSGILRVGR